MEGDDDDYNIDDNDVNIDDDDVDDDNDDNDDVRDDNWIITITMTMMILLTML